MTRSLDDADKASRAASSGVLTPSGTGRLNSEAFNRFRSADSRGATSSPSATSNGGPSAAGGGSTELETIHQNTITKVKAYEFDAQGDVTKVSTSGVDGRLVIWDVAGGGTLAGRMGRLGL